MPTDVTPPVGEQQALRFAIGVAGIFILAMAIGWPIGFLAAVFAAMFLQGTAPVPAEPAVRLLAIFAALLGASFFLSSFLLTYPVVFLIALLTALLVTFRYATSGGSPLISVLALLAVLLVPVIAKSSVALAGEIAGWLIVNMAIALMVQAFMFTLFPAPPQKQVPPKSPIRDGESLSRAITMTLVTAPLAIAFFSFGWSSVLTLIFAAIMAQQLSAATTMKAGQVILIANCAGGLAAIIAYEFIVIAPFFPFMVALVLGICIAAARFRFSGMPNAVLAGSALNALLVLLGGAMAPFGDEVDAKFGDRIVQIAVAVAYLIIAFEFVSLLTRRRRPERLAASSAVDPTPGADAGVGTGSTG